MKLAADCVTAAFVALAGAADALAAALATVLADAVAEAAAADDAFALDFLAEGVAADDATADDAAAAGAAAEAADAPAPDEATTPWDVAPALDVSVAMLLVSFPCSVASLLSRSDVSLPDA